jgi:hypothetical protein
LDLAAMSAMIDDVPSRHPQSFQSDLFKSASDPASPPSKMEDQLPTPRHRLPSDLPNALRHLEDAEFDSLVAAVGEEARRRNRSQSNSMAGARVRQRDGDGDPIVLTKAKLHAIRAAFKAGVKPATIARQFGVSLAAVRAALASK